MEVKTDGSTNGTSRRSTRISVPPDRLIAGMYTNEVDPSTVDVVLAAVSASVPANRTPWTLKEAYAGPDADAWRRAFKAEYDGFRDKKTYEVVHHNTVPSGAKVLHMMNVLTENVNEHGVVVRKMVRGVVFGNFQRKGIDYSETFAAACHNLASADSSVATEGWSDRIWFA